MSPELLRGDAFVIICILSNYLFHSYNNKSDLWSLGCLIYEMAALRLPWSAASISLLLDKIEKNPCDPLPHQVYSKEFNNLVMMLLQRVCVFDLYAFHFICVFTSFFFFFLLGYESTCHY
jgi:serine/threonine protein kinase